MCHDPGMDRGAATVARIAGVAAGVRRSALAWGWGSVSIGVAAWVVVVWEPWEPQRSATAWSPLLVAALVPGIIVLGFARRVGHLSRLSGRLGDEIGSAAVEARLRPAGEKRGLRALAALLRVLRDQGDDVRRVVAEAAGTVRVFNPAYLGLVVPAALATGLVAIVGIVAIVVEVL